MPPAARGDLLEVALDAAAVGLVVVRRDRQHGVDAGRHRPLGQLDRVARVVGARRRRRSVPSSPSSSAISSITREVLLVGQRRRPRRSSRRPRGRPSRWRAGGGRWRRRPPRRRCRRRANGGDHGGEEAFEAGAWRRSLARRRGKGARAGSAGRDRGQALRRIAVLGARRAALGGPIPRRPAAARAPPSGGRTRQLLRRRPGCDALAEARAAWSASAVPAAGGGCAVTARGGAGRASRR